MEGCSLRIGLHYNIEKCMDRVKVIQFCEAGKEKGKQTYAETEVDEENFYSLFKIRRQYQSDWHFHNCVKRENHDVYHGAHKEKCSLLFRSYRKFTCTGTVEI